MKPLKPNRTADGQLACRHGTAWGLKPAACCKEQLERDCGSAEMRRPPQARRQALLLDEDAV